MKNAENQNTTDNTYNGWKNRQTWNVSLWINNDQYLYDIAKDFINENPDVKTPYLRFVESYGLNNEKTLDGIRFKSTKLDYEALDEMIRELLE